jgi:ornithine cyclodeaminase/alanine dehydrogenase-like protein (mu-crystallin family)
MLDKMLAVAGASALLIASALGVARAADLPLKAAPAPVYSWTGFYVGLNGGYGLAEDPFSQTASLGGITESSSISSRGVSSADIITSATLATSPLIKGEWLRPGVHVDLIGGFTPGMREADDEAVRRSAVFVDTAEALREVGDHPFHRKWSLLAGRSEGIAGGPLQEEITMLKAVGIALADLAAASMVYNACTMEAFPR